MAHHQQHFRSVGAQGFNLRVQTAAQLHGLVEDTLRRCAPLVNCALRTLVVPDAALTQGGHVVVGQFLPCAGFVKGKLRVKQGGLNLNKARHARHHPARPAVVEQRPKSHQRVAKGVVARQRLHGCPGAAVRRAQHQQACALARHHALPGFRFFKAHGACHQSAHGVCQQPHRLATQIARGQRRINRSRQTAGLVFYRAAPIIGKRDDLMGICQAFNQVVIDAANRAVGLNAGGRGRVPCELFQAIDKTKAQPDAFAMEFEIGAQNAGQHEYRRAIRRIGRWPATGARHRPGTARATGVLPGPGQRADGREVGRRGLHQRTGNRLHRALIGKVIEVRNLGTPVQQETCSCARRRCGARHTAVH